MSAFHRRKPRTRAERRAREDGVAPAVRPRGYLPDRRDDLYARCQRSWKRHRATQYKTRNAG